MAEYYLEFEKPIEELKKQIDMLESSSVVDENIKLQIEQLKKDMRI